MNFDVTLYTIHLKHKKTMFINQLFDPLIRFGFPQTPDAVSLLQKAQADLVQHGFL